MNYSTFNLQNFFIKKNSTMPILKFPLTQGLMEKYDITSDMLENVAVTFSMRDAETGNYRIANVSGDLKIADIIKEHDELKYTLIFKFTEKQTRKSGRFLGEFKLDFLGEFCGKITLPTDGYINILISDSQTKTTVI